MAAFAGQMVWREEQTWTMVRRLQLRLVRSGSRPDEEEWDGSDLEAWSASLAHYYRRQPPEPPELLERARAAEQVASAWRRLGEWGPARAALQDALALYRRLFAERLAARAGTALRELAQ